MAHCIFFRVFLFTANNKLLMFSFDSRFSNSKIYFTIFTISCSYSSCFFLLLDRLNFWVHSVIIKLIPCLVLTVISFILIRVLCQAAKRKDKLKQYNQTATSAAVKANAALNGHRYDEHIFYSYFYFLSFCF